MRVYAYKTIVWNILTYYCTSTPSLYGYFSKWPKLLSGSDTWSHLLAKQKQLKRSWMKPLQVRCCWSRQGTRRMNQLHKFTSWSPPDSSRNFVSYWVLLSYWYSQHDFPPSSSRLQNAAWPPRYPQDWNGLNQSSQPSAWKDLAKWSGTGLKWKTLWRSTRIYQAKRCVNGNSQGPKSTQLHSAQLEVGHDHGCSPSHLHILLGPRLCHQIPRGRQWA